MKTSTLNVSPLCQGCELIRFAERNGIMFHQCDICRAEYEELIQREQHKEQDYEEIRK